MVIIDLGMVHATYSIFFPLKTAGDGLSSSASPFSAGIHSAWRRRSRWLVQIWQNLGCSNEL